MPLWPSADFQKKVPLSLQPRCLRVYGRVVLRFTITAGGQVVNSAVANTTMNNGRVETCVVKAARRWLFPKPKGGGVVVVALPMVFRSVK